ncbi:MAG: hypothetical protein WCK67_03460 [bacterium]
MSKSLKILFIFLISLIMFASTADISSAKKSKGMTDAQITELTTTINDLTQKVYSASLFSPQENNKLVDIKMKLDAAIAIDSSNPAYPMLYYKTGILYKAREYKDDAADCFQTIIDLFGDTPYAAKAMTELKKMGVKVVAPAPAQ